MKISNVTFQVVLDRVDKYVADGKKPPTHIFIDPISFQNIKTDMANNIAKYWLPHEYSRPEYMRGRYNISFIHAHGQAFIIEVLCSERLLLIGDEKAFLNYSLEKELLGAK